MAYVHFKYYLTAMQIPTHFYLGGKKVSTALWAGLIELNCSAQHLWGFWLNVLDLLLYLFLLSQLLNLEP